jgi:hypothetical protein
MSVRKLSKEQWAFEVKRAMTVRDRQQKKMRQAKFLYFERILDKALPISILIGLTAMSLLVWLYGWVEFFKFFLSWIVSLTLVATGAYYLWKSYEKQL